MTNAEYFIAHNRRDVSDLEILIRLAQEASKLANAALERTNHGNISKEHRDDRELAAAIGRMQAVAAISAERIGLKDKAISASRDKLGKAWALKIDPEWRCASNEQD